MAFDITQADAILKEDYQELVEQLSNEVFLLAQLEKNSETAEGRRALHSLHLGRNGGIGGAQTGGDLPTAGSQKYVDAYVPLRKRYATIQVERQLKMLTASNSGAFVRAVDAEMKGVRNDVRVDEGRMVYGTSDGVVAATGITAASTTVVLASTTSATQLRQLAEFADPSGAGRRIDIGTVATPTSVASARFLLTVDETAKTITISGAAVTTAATDRIFWAGQGGASTNSNLQNDGQIELTGIQTIVNNTGTLHGVSSTTYPKWKSYVSENGGVNRNVSEALVNTAIANVETVSGGQVDILLSNFGVFNALAADMRAMRRNVDNVDLKAGFSGLAYTSAGMGRQGSSTRALVWDRDCPNNRLFGLTTEDLVNYEAGGWSWIDDTGSIFRLAAGSAAGLYTDQLVASLARYHDIAAHKRNSHFVIKDLSEA